MLNEHPHRRLNILTGEWVLVSPHRTKRPWQGQVEKQTGVVEPEYDPSCYLCPRNARAGDSTNPDYAATFVFDNDFAALYPEVEPQNVNENGLLIAESEKGVCRVICFSPRHDLTLAKMTVDEITQVVKLWAGQFSELAEIPFINAVQIFENRGAMMGASNPHPHCQIWATASVPNELAKEVKAFAEYASSQNSCLLCDYVELELEKRERIVCENSSFAVVVPYWAVYPFETIVLPKFHAASIDALTDNQEHDLADILHRITVRYDNLFQTDFPYSMGFHQHPTDNSDHSGFHFHGHFYPPLLRSATVRKFLVGFEILGGPQRDITPETAAQMLREQSEIRFCQNRLR